MQKVDENVVNINIMPEEVLEKSTLNCQESKDESEVRNTFFC